MAEESDSSKILTRAQGDGASKTGVRGALTTPMLLALCLALVCCVAWAFFMGLMVGRGQNPQAGIAAMTGMTLDKERELNKTDDQIKDAEAIDDRSIFAIDEPKGGAAIQGPSGALPEAAANAPKTASTDAAAVHAPPTGASANAWPDAVMPETGARAPQPKVAPKNSLPPKAQVIAQPDQRHNYSFQVAALKSQEDAARLRKELAAQGLKAEIRKNGKVLLLIVNIRGGKAELDAFSAKLKKLRLGKPVQLSKTPIATRGAKK